MRHAWRGCVLQRLGAFEELTFAIMRTVRSLVLSLLIFDAIFEIYMKFHLYTPNDSGYSLVVSDKMKGAENRPRLRDDALNGYKSNKIRQFESIASIRASK